jgi:hypothetical protein
MMKLKRTVCRLLLGLALSASVVFGGDWDNTLRGALVGGAFGALVSEFNGVDARTGVPAFAALGALVGYGRDRNWYHSRRYDDYWLDYGWPYNHARYHDDNWRWLNRRRRYDRNTGGGVTVMRAATAADAQQSQPAAPAEPQLHPGVSLVIVPITLPRGMIVNLRILKLGNRYVGPQGEPYATLPTAEQLLERYTPPE